MDYPTDAVTRLGLYNGAAYDASLNPYGMGEGGFRQTLPETGRKLWDQQWQDASDALAYLAGQVANAAAITVYLTAAGAARDGAVAALSAAEAGAYAAENIADRLSAGRLWHEAGLRFAAGL